MVITGPPDFLLIRGEGEYRIGLNQLPGELSRITDKNDIPESFSQMEKGFRIGVNSGLIGDVHSQKDQISVPAAVLHDLKHI